MAARKQKRPWPPNCELCNISSLTSVSGVLYPPRSPAPSARDFSSSKEAPPVTSCRSSLQHYMH